MRLSPIEMKLVETHAASGFEILQNIEFPWPVATIILQHHERLDGSATPAAFAERRFSWKRESSRCDTVEAMASHRPYRPSLGIDAAIDELTSKRGVLYDSAVVDACCRVIKEQRLS